MLFQSVVGYRWGVVLFSGLLAGRNKRGPKTVGGVFEREGR